MKVSNQIIRTRELEKMRLSQILSCRLSLTLHNVCIDTAGELMHIPLMVWIKNQELTEADIKEIFEKVVLPFF